MTFYRGDSATAGGAGVDGLTPFIGPNGNWWIGTTDTGVHAQGPQGIPGIQGNPGIQGIPGPAGSGGSGVVDLSEVPTKDGIGYSKFDSRTISVTGTYFPLLTVPFPCIVTWLSLIWNIGGQGGASTAASYWKCTLGKFPYNAADQGSPLPAFVPIVSKITFWQYGAGGYSLGENIRSGRAWTFDDQIWDLAAAQLQYRDTLALLWDKAGSTATPANISQIDASFRVREITS